MIDRTAPFYVLSLIGASVVMAFDAPPTPVSSANRRTAELAQMAHFRIRPRHKGVSSAGRDAFRLRKDQGVGRGINGFPDRPVVLQAQASAPVP